MPRLARLDVVGMLHHVMVRGIEKRDIFLDDQDRRRFLDHFSELLIKTETTCLAWALMANHFHLLLRPHKMKLSFFMRRLLTSYALGFNVRHDRTGHLFQNRYRSIVCQEEPYLLELIRYIHLNPVRAGIISSGSQLQRYRWSGHSVVMGEADLAGQNTVEILARFGDDLLRAREKYHAFVVEEIEAGHQDHLSSGGEVRDPFVVSGKAGEESIDSRVLGSGDFVEQLWEVQEQEIQKPKVPLATVLQVVASALNLEVELLYQAGKRHDVSRARAVACYVAMRELGYSGVAIARALGLTSGAVTRAADRGEAMVKQGHCRELLLQIRMSKS